MGVWAPSRLLPKLQLSPPQPAPLVISWPGAGVLVFWQLGVLKGLSESHDLSNVPMLGSSSGALITALAKSGTCIDTATVRGVELLQEFGVVHRKWGLIGMLGKLTRQWLADVLPDQAAERCSQGQAMLLVTTLPLFRTRAITGFKCNSDLVDAVMASAHIPLVVDWRMFVSCRWRPCLDGGLWWLLQRSEKEYHPPHADNALLITPFKDANIVKDLHILRRLRPNDLGVAKELVQMGMEYAHGFCSEHAGLLQAAAAHKQTADLHSNAAGSYALAGAVPEQLPRRHTAPMQTAILDMTQTQMP